MNEYAFRRKQAIDACDKAINGIEDETLSVSSSLLTCIKIARLVNDWEGQEWLKYEYGGYPTSDAGIPSEAWQIGAKHGRMYKCKNKNKKTIECIFTELCGELESVIENNKKAINNYSTQGFSVSGQYTLATTTVCNALLAETQTGKPKNLTILGHIADPP